MKTHPMKVIEGSPGHTRTVIYSYRGHSIIRRMRTSDPRNKTHNGYDWGGQFSDGRYFNAATRDNAKIVIDARVQQELADKEDSI